MTRLSEADRYEMAVLLPQLAGGLVEAGLQKDAPLLVDQGTGLWRHQIGAASAMVEPLLQRRARDLIERLCAQAIMLQQHWPGRCRYSAGASFGRTAGPDTPVQAPNRGDELYVETRGR